MCRAASLTNLAALSPPVTKSSLSMTSRVHLESSMTPAAIIKDSAVSSLMRKAMSFRMSGLPLPV
ncbi:hypothetical protein Barb7_00551 [Bacteroidales bacterium Barb7]|nr:hypothetical protein Barb7_00551 [Bacteroidales bacterium Barb7]